MIFHCTSVQACFKNNHCFRKRWFADRCRHTHRHRSPHASACTTRPWSTSPTWTRLGLRSHPFNKKSRYLKAAFQFNKIKTEFLHARFVRSNRFQMPCDHAPISGYWNKPHRPLPACTRSFFFQVIICYKHKKSNSIENIYPLTMYLWSCMYRQNTT
jgi:hypothetical protein